MNQRISYTLAGLLALFAVGLWLFPSAQAQNPAFSLAFVDLKRVSVEYEGTKRSQEELEQYQKSLAKQLQDRDDIRFLDDKEREEMTTLRAVASPNDQQKKRMTDLLAASKARADQLRSLQQNPNKTETEKAEFDRLSNLSAKTDTDLDTLGGQLDELLDKKGQELSKQLTDTVTTSISNVAKAKGYTAVVDKQAVLFGGADITDDVMKDLNKK